jgi:hypothetical protein
MRSMRRRRWEGALEVLWSRDEAIYTPWWWCCRQRIRVVGERRATLGHSVTQSLNRNSSEKRESSRMVMVMERMRMRREEEKERKKQKSQE